MLNFKSVIGTCFFALILTEVIAWTIDLPEARKFYFERNAHKRGDENKIYFNRQPELVDYNNIAGNSFHNAPIRHEGVNGGQLDGNGKYAGDYGYHTYMEKKVHGIVYKGAIYLEGLRVAMERYSRQLENCTRLERSRPQSNRTWVPELESEPRPLNATEEAMTACEKATRDSEHVRRVAELVVWAIRELQDVQYADKYDKATKESQEDVLLLQLAWALDELARLTGYEPDPQEFAVYPTPAPAPTTTPLTYFYLPIPNDGPTGSDCIKRGDQTVPATVRCALSLPDAVRDFLNMSSSSSLENSTLTTGARSMLGMFNNSASSNTSSTQRMMNLLAMFNNSGTGEGQQSFNNMSPDEVRRRMLACVAAAPDAACRGFQTFLQFLNNMSFPQQPQNSQPQNFNFRPNREVDSSDSQQEILEAAEQHSVKPLRKLRKRSANEPLKNVVNYYFKYKAWTNTNPDAEPTVKPDSYDVSNHLTPVKTIQKRSISDKDGKKIVAKIPEDPMQDLSNFIKHKSGVHINKDTTQAEKLKAYLEKILHGDGLIVKNNVRKLNKMVKSVHKRSVYHQYHRKLTRPRVSEDPMQDISYYVKNKPGTNIRPNLANAAQVRVGVQEIFQRGNIEVVRRFGSNYVPGVQPLMLGAIQSFTDF